MLTKYTISEQELQNAVQCPECKKCLMGRVEKEYVLDFGVCLKCDQAICHEEYRAEKQFLNFISCDVEQYA